MGTRELKFRAWRHNQIWYSDFIITYRGKINWWNSDIGDYSPILFNKGEGIMQFTGLKDKNGKEIYEGDIIKPEDWEGRVLEVIFINGTWELQLIQGKRKRQRGGWMLANFILDSKVIGNKFENPELLK